MKIPPDAKQVFKGVIFSVYQWQQQLYDGTKVTFEALKRPATIHIIPTQGAYIFLSYEEQPMKERTYTLLGGRQQEGEEPLLTARRELLEETGFTSNNWELIKIYESEGKIQWDTYLFIARDCQKVAEPELDAGEKIEVKKVTFDDFIQIASSESFWGRDFTNDVLRLRLDLQQLEVFKKKLFL